MRPGRLEGSAWETWCSQIEQGRWEGGDALALEPSSRLWMFLKENSWNVLNDWELGDMSCLRVLKDSSICNPRWRAGEGVAMVGETSYQESPVASSMMTVAGPPGRQGRWRTIRGLEVQLTWLAGEVNTRNARRKGFSLSNTANE